jgi:hypothetical protein
MLEARGATFLRIRAFYDSSILSPHKPLIKNKANIDEFNF